MTKGTLVILRHGQTEYNKNHLMTGQADVPLTALGEAQGHAAGLLLEGIVFDKAYASNLMRAFNTAALAIGASKNQPRLQKADGTWDIEQRAEIAEVHTGDFTGRNHKTDPEIRAWPRAFDRPLPNGESDKDAVARVQKFFDAELLPRMLKGETVLVVAHAGILRAFDIVLGVVPHPETAAGTSNMRSVPNATPEVFEFENGRLTSFHRLDNPVKPEDATPPANSNSKNNSQNPRKLG